ncbi:hypothetical protein DUI87_09725 [Hirundo rustica rustica]|uniref:Uncharacterized protein n=1 Tax=Hirundo rustica rustica TaxID=333673 RepID=A0A3M0KLV3_HIRRU|nr:hypothetical protein DUI87_09725 [Hirundo rustica rustica]
MGDTELMEQVKGRVTKLIKGLEHLFNRIRGNGQKLIHEEVPPEHKEELLYCAVTKYWARLSREVLEPSSLEMFRNHLDSIPCLVLWDAPAQAERLDQDDQLWSLPA